MKNLNLRFVFGIALNILMVSSAFGASKLVTPNTSPNLYSHMRTTECGQTGKLQERIFDCNESIILPESNSRITTVSIDINEGRIERWLLDEYTQRIWSPPARNKMNFPQAENYCRSLNKKNNQPFGLRKWTLPIYKYESIKNQDSTGGLLSAFNNSKLNRIGIKTDQNDPRYASHPTNPLIKKVFNNLNGFWIYWGGPDDFKRWFKRNDLNYGKVENIFDTLSGRNFITVDGLSGNIFVLCQSEKVRGL